MKRRLLILCALLLALGGAGLGWLGYSAGGLAVLARVAATASDGRLRIEAPAGSLLGGELAVERLAWTEPDLEITVSGLRLAWSPGELLRGRLAIAAAALDRVHIDVASSDAEGAPPASLQLPLAVDVEKLQISQLTVGPLVSFEHVTARYAADASSHRLEQLRGAAGNTEIAGAVVLGAAAPFPLQLSATLSGQLADKALRLALAADGTLARIALKLAAEEGVRGEGAAILTPFARRPFAAASIDLTDLDPAAWRAGAPAARLAVHVRVQPDAREAGILGGDFALHNAMPGPLDRQRLPLEKLAGRFAWRDDVLHLADLRADLPGRGRLSGAGRWQDGRLGLDLQAAALDLAHVAAVMQPTRLAGPLSASLGLAGQSLSCRLADSRFTLALDTAHGDGKLSVPRLELAAGDSRLTVQGELALGGALAFEASGALTRFDPSRFARVPAALVNAEFSASGRLTPSPVVRTQFALRDSRLAGQPLAGQGEVVVDWPHIPKAAVELSAGPNRLLARGAFGQPGERLEIDLALPALAPYGLVGGFSGHLQLGGTPGQATLAGELQAARFGVPGVGVISDGRLVAELAAAPDSPLRITAQAAAFDAPAWPGLLRDFSLQLAGSRGQHSLQLNAAIAGKNRLALSADGGLAGDLRQAAWSGRLLSASLVAELPQRSFALSLPAPLSLSRDGWRVGPLEINGDAWQLRAAAAAAGKRLQAEFSGRGPRIGQVSGKIEAGLRDAWSLDRQAPWQGAAQFAIADLGWLSEWLADGWQTGGRVNGELSLAGTPERPLASGRWRGEQLGLAAPEQGLKLINGQLDASLADNLLRVTQLAFDSVLQAPPRALRQADGEALAQLVAKPGRLEISGEMRVDPEAGSAFYGSVGDGAALDLRLERVGVYQLPDQWVMVSGDGRVAWAKDTLAVRSKLAVDAAYWQLAPLGTPKLSDDVLVKRPAGSQEPAGLRPRLDLDVETDLGRNFHFRGAGLSARLAGSVRVLAQGRDLPRASGRIRTRDGRFDAYGQQLEIERGVLTFQGLLDNPALDARAVRKGLPVEAGVQVSGTAQKPVVRLVSDPDLPDVEKLSWLVLGHGPEQGGAADATVLLGAAGSLLGNDSGGIMQQIKQGFGIDEFSLRQGQIDGLGGRQPGSRVVGGSFDATSTTGNQILSVGKRLSNNALLSYEQTLGRAESVVKLSIALNRQLSLIARAGSDNALDLLYTITFGDPPARRAAPAVR